VVGERGGGRKERKKREAEEVKRLEVEVRSLVDRSRERNLLSVSSSFAHLFRRDSHPQRCMTYQPSLTIALGPARRTLRTGESSRRWTTKGRRHRSRSTPRLLLRRRRASSSRLVELKPRGGGPVSADARPAKKRTSCCFPSSPREREREASRRRK